MTNEEAIENLSKMYLVGTSDRRSNQVSVKNHNDALDYVIGKMTPKKPIKDDRCYRCYCCDSLVYKFQNNCEMCMQAIDWGK